MATPRTSPNNRGTKPTKTPAQRAEHAKLVNAVKANIGPKLGCRVPRHLRRLYRSDQDAGTG